MSTLGHLYNIHADFPDNMANGPEWSGTFPKLKNTEKVSFLGKKLNSVFGVPACPLTANSKFIQVLSKLGYDILTYKSVRSVEWQGNVFPHWTYINHNLEVIEQREDDDSVTMANSFGIHSTKPEVWQADVNKTISTVLNDNQLLILSLMCTPNNQEKLIADARRLGRLANETEAEVFELNLACPNTDGGKGLIFEDVEHSVELLNAVKTEVGDKKVFAKVGHFSNEEILKDFLNQTRGIIDGISSTNTAVKKVTTSTGKEYFPGRLMAGVSGSMIKNASQAQARLILEYKAELNLSQLVVLGMGGVTVPKDIEEYLKIGVDAVQSAVGVYEDPYLASKWKHTLKGEL